MSTIISTESARLPSRTTPSSMMALSNSESAPSASGFSLPSILQRNWKYLVFAGTVSAAIAIAAGAYLSKNTWSFTSELLYQRPATASVGSTGLEVLTLKNLIKSRNSLEQICREFKLEMPTKTLDKLILVDVPMGSASMHVTLDWEEPGQAEAMLNRLVAILVTRLNDMHRSSLERVCRYREANFNRSREELVTAQREFNAFSDRTKIVDLSEDLTSIKERIALLEGEARKNVQDQYALLNQKTKPTTLGGSLISIRAGMNDVSLQILSLRKQMEELLASREEFNRLSDRVTIAETAYERSEEQWADAQQALDTRTSDVVVVQAARPALEPVKSTRKKITMGVFALTSFLLCIPLLLIEWRKTRQSPLALQAQRLGVPLLAAAPLTDDQDSALLTLRREDYVRLLALRIQQSLETPRSVVLFSNLWSAPVPKDLLSALAKCFAQRGHRVLLIETSNDLSKNDYVEGAGEGDCSSAVGDTTLAHHPSPPNAECQIVDRLDLDRLLTHTAMPGVDSLVLHGASLPREVFATSFMTDLLRELRERYTLVLLGGPDISHSVDVELLAASVDGIVFYSDGKQVSSAAEAVHELQGLQAPILGITG